MNTRALATSMIQRGMLRIGLFALLAICMTSPNLVAAPTKPGTSPKIPIAPLHEGITAFVPLDNAPFPFRGRIPDSGKDFLDLSDGDRQGHVSPRDGSVHLEDETFKDNRVLLYLPQGFDVRKPALIVVFFHGNGATLSRDVLDRQQVAAQLAASGINAVLVAPQFAIDAADSSAGRFWQRGHFAKFVTEAATKLAAQYGDRRAAAAFKQSKVVLVAYSGGYLPAAWALDVGKIGTRLQGLVLFDAMYGQLDKFASWLEHAHNSAFFFSAFGESTHDENEALKEQLDEANLRYKTALPNKLLRGSISFINVGTDVKHEDFVTQAWTQNPLAWVLSRIPGYPRSNANRARNGRPR